MANYHPAQEDEFSPKKYAVVGAVKELFKYSGHQSEEGHEDQDMVYRQEKLYGTKEDEDNPFSKDYHKKDEQDEFGRKKDIKPSGFEEKIMDNSPEKYKPNSNDEIAQVLFSKTNMQSFGEDISDNLFSDNELNVKKKKNKTKKHAENKEANEDDEAEEDEKINEEESSNEDSIEEDQETNVAKEVEKRHSKKKNKPENKTVEDIIGDLPWQSKH